MDLVSFLKPIVRRVIPSPRLRTAFWVRLRGGHHMEPPTSARGGLAMDGVVDVSPCDERNPLRVLLRTHGTTSAGVAIRKAG